MCYYMVPVTVSVKNLKDITGGTAQGFVYDYKLNERG